MTYMELVVCIRMSASRGGSVLRHWPLSLGGSLGSARSFLTGGGGYGGQDDEGIVFHGDQ
jgi:hypothetical protein